MTADAGTVRPLASQGHGGTQPKFLSILGPVAQDLEDPTGITAIITGGTAA